MGFFENPPRAPTRRKRGWVRIVIGALLLGAGIFGTIAGIVMAVQASDAIRDDAVATGEVREGEGRAVSFIVPAGGREDYTVWLSLHGRDGDENRADLIVRDTACVARMPDGVETRFRGARQGTAATIGSASSVGHFSSQPGEVVVFCGYSDGTRSSRRIRPEQVEYVVSRGTPGQASRPVLVILGGVSVALLGGALLVWGLIGSRAPVPLPPRTG